MRKTNIASIIISIILIIITLICPLDINNSIWLIIIPLGIAEFILFIIAGIKRYQAIKNELKEDKLYSIAAALNTIGLVISMVITLSIDYDFEGWDGLGLVVMAIMIIGFVILNTITYIISENLCINLWLNMEEVDNNIKQRKRKKNRIINIAIIVGIVAIILFILGNTTVYVNTKISTL